MTTVLELMMQDAVAIRARHAREGVITPEPQWKTSTPPRSAALNRRIKDVAALRKEGRKGAVIMKYLGINGSELRYAVQQAKREGLL